MQTGRTVHVGEHVGEKGSYVALFSFGNPGESLSESYRTKAGLNHIAVVVEDLEATGQRVKSAGYVTENHADYEPGRRFYFTGQNGIEIEVVAYS